MSDFKQYRDRSRDVADGAERGTYGTMEVSPAGGMMMSVKGTGTTDIELPVVNFGYGFNVPADTNAEVIMLSQGSDVNNKVALPQIPRDKQYQWPENSGGIQNPMDPEKRIEMDGDGTHLTDGEFTAGPNKEVAISISGGNVTLSTSGELNVKGGKLSHNGKNVGSDHTHEGVEPGGGTTGAPT